MFEKVSLDKNIDEKKSNRKSVEYNAMELVLPMLILNKDINNYDQLVESLKNIDQTKIIFNDFKFDFKNYENDIHNKKKIINNYITNFQNINSHKTLQTNKIKCIYICGKKNKHDEINKLNKHLDKKETKADIYIKYKDGSILGISIKQSIECTKSNYSVQKMLGDKLDKILTQVKKTYLNNNGFISFKESERDEINKLFYPQNKENIYWNRIKTEIQNNNEQMIKQIIESLYGLNLNYELYEFDGNKYIKLNEKIDLSTVTFVEYPEYYLTKSGHERKAAKLFYRLKLVIKKNIK
jgi:hypothetical protein